MMTQTDISNILNCSQTTIHFIVTGQRKVSRPLAEKLSEMYRGTGFKFWREIAGDQFISTISELEKETAEAQA